MVTCSEEHARFCSDCTTARAYGSIHCQDCDQGRPSAATTDNDLGAIVAAAVSPSAAAAYTQQTAEPLTAETIRAAVRQLRDAPWPPLPPPIVVHPYTHDACNDELGRPHGTPITRADLAEVMRRLYDRCTPEERERLLAYSLGWQGW